MAAAAGVSRQALYLHFSDRAALYVERMWEDLVVARGWSRRRYERHVHGTLERTLVEPAAG